VSVLLKLLMHKTLYNISRGVKCPLLPMPTGAHSAACYVVNWSSLRLRSKLFSWPSVYSVFEVSAVQCALWACCLNYELRYAEIFVRGNGNVVRKVAANGNENSMGTWLKMSVENGNRVGNYYTGLDPFL